MFEKLLSYITGKAFLVSSIFALLLLDASLPWLDAFNRNRVPEFVHIACFGMAIGAVAVQFNLIGFWAVLSKERLLYRLVSSICLVTLIWFAILFGDYFYGHDMQEAGLLGAVLFLGSWLSLCPFWVARVYFNWTLINKNNRSSDRKLSISDLMLCTGILAILLGAGRMLLPNYSLAIDPRYFQGLISFLCILTINLIYLVPVTWLSFRKVVRFESQLAVCLVGVPFVSLVEFLACAIIFGAPASDTGSKLFSLILALNLGQFFVTYIVAKAFLASGFRLIQSSTPI